MLSRCICSVNKHLQESQHFFFAGRICNCRWSASARFEWPGNVPSCVPTFLHLFQLCRPYLTFHIFTCIPVKKFFFHGAYVLVRRSMLWFMDPMARRMKRHGKITHLLGVATSPMSPAHSTSIISSMAIKR